MTIDAIDRRNNLIALINTWNESSSPSVPRTDEEHAIERDRARIALRSIKRNYIEGKDYRELSSGALWPMAEVSDREFTKAFTPNKHGEYA